VHGFAKYQNERLLNQKGRRGKKEIGDGEVEDG
jgi:hypothetical protein